MLSAARHKNRELLTIPEAHVSPDPVGIPGDLAVTGIVQINREAAGDVSLEVTIERYVGFFWLTVPCVSGVGSWYVCLPSWFLQWGFRRKETTDSLSQSPWPIPCQTLQIQWNPSF